MKDPLLSKMIQGLTLNSLYTLQSMIKNEVIFRKGLDRDEPEGRLKTIINDEFCGNIALLSEITEAEFLRIKQCGPNTLVQAKEELRKRKLKFKKNEGDRF